MLSINFVILALIILLCILAEGFFSGSEIAIVSSNKALVRQRVGNESRVAKLLEEFKKRPERLLSAHVIGTNFSAIIATSVATLYFRAKYGEIGELYTLLLTSPLILVFGEMVPKMIFRHYAEMLTPKSITGLDFFAYIFSPVLLLMSLLANLASRILGGDKLTNEPFITRQELEFILTSASYKKEIPAQKKKMLKRVLRFSETPVKAVQVPLVEVVAMEENEQVDKVITKASVQAYSRYPVYRQRIDNIVGILEAVKLIDVKDPSVPIKGLMHTPYYVPETMPVDELLQKMQLENFSMAIVVDEYGGCSGLITREDILEEIVGEIEDEHDLARPLYREIGANRWIIEARMEIDQINDLFNFNLPKGDYETLGGFLLDKLKHIPKPGEIYRHENISFLVRRADERSIKEILVVKEEPAQPQD